MEIIFELVEFVRPKTSAVVVYYKKENGFVSDKTKPFHYKEEVLEELEKYFLLGLINKKYYDIKLKEILSLDIDSKKHNFFFRFFFKDRPPFREKRIASFNISLSLDEEKKIACFLLDGFQATPFFNSKEQGKYYLLFFLKAEVITKEKRDEVLEDLKNSSVLLEYVNPASNN
jgi:hypothetical protein